MSEPLPGNSKEATPLAKGEEESDEAKESEADLTEVSFSCLHIVLANPPTQVGSMAKSSQTEPLGRRYSTGASKEQQDEDEGEDEEEEEDEEDEAEDQSEEKEKQGAGASRPPAYPILGANFQCNLCQISLNSQSQVAQVAHLPPALITNHPQHMGSNKHRRVGALATPRGVKLPGKEGGRRECREIPMLSMFLQVCFLCICPFSRFFFQRLHQHHYFPPIRVTKESSSSNYN